MKKVILFIGAAIFMIACSGNNQKEEAEHAEMAAKPEVKTEMVEENVSVINLNSNDQMRFDKSEIRVKAGAKVKLTLNHTGQMAKEVMGHNFVLLNQGVVTADFATEAVAAGLANNYVPEHSKDVIVHTITIGGGQSTTIEFDAPAVGTYDFICSFPGHYGMMNGKFIVE
ncbi:MAG: azurin [Salibacteraceae bacterium]|nr:azurin [Salibacteraceae bacterium]